MTDKNDDKDDKKAPPKQKASLGRIVHYALSEADVERIRVHLVIGECQPLFAGGIVAAVVTRVGEHGDVHLKLLLDAETRYDARVCDAKEGTLPGCWMWPAKV